ncbi:MAG: hypothetical protein EXX96DRAFT_622956 [Benjaminiella poitrasii]|nr:MAG: hypothetical protein EXX96DRAFT_622956 [Benjaminiella poitrasii]
MDFIHYNPAKEPLLAYDDSSDKVVFDDLVIQYGEVRMLIDIDTVRVHELQSIEIEEEMKNLGLKCFKNAIITKYKKCGLDQIGRFLRIVQGGRADLAESIRTMRYTLQ